MNFRRLFIIVLLVLVAAGLIAGAAMYFKDRQGPVLALEPDSGIMNDKRELTLTATDDSGLRFLEVAAVQGDKTSVLDSESPADKPSRMQITFNLGKAKLKDGPFQISVRAVDHSIFNFGKGNGAQADFNLVLDTRPPSIAVLSGAHNVNHGGCGLVAYTVSEDAAKSGVAVGDAFFPGYKQDNGTYLAFFAFPYYMDIKDFDPLVTAEDQAGNTAKAGFRHLPKEHKFRDDSLNLSTSFLETKMPQFRDEFPESGTDLEVFLKVNSELRERNRAYHFELARKTSPRPLWKGAFLRMPNTAPMALFGDKRTYYYQGAEVDRQTHLGVDLASVEADEVPAANSGLVIFTGEFGIYGQTVVIDHGLGLMTLYGHLRQIDVHDGDEVERGRIIGRTGATGLAGGDHLHFGVYLSGVPVNPIEWWDQHWIDDNVVDRIGM